MDTNQGYFERHREQAFIVKAMALILVIIYAKEALKELLPYLLIIFTVLFIYYIRYQKALTRRSFLSLLSDHLTLMPVMVSEEERKKEKTPWVTYGLVLCNVIIFYAFQSTADFQAIAGNLILLPEQPNFWNLPVSALTYMFLHNGSGHLWGNMGFLWVVGSAVERRIDSGNFFFLYLFTGLLGGILYVLVEFFAQNSAGHVLGASGAIAGIMGIFAIRCYFKSMIFPVPIFGAFSLVIPLSLKIRLNSLVIIGLFFYSDLSGGLAQLSGYDSSIGHWVHLGGMITGMIAAGIFLRLGEAAIEERHLDIGMKAAETAMNFGEGVKSIRIALEQNPDNGEALLTLARLKTKFNVTEEGGELYCKALSILVKSDPHLAIKTFWEYNSKGYRTAEPKLLDSLGYCALRLKEKNAAVKCFSLLADHPRTPSVDRERALFQCGKALEEMGEFEEACERYAFLVQEFPDSDVVPKLRIKVASFGLSLPQFASLQGGTEPTMPPEAPTDRGTLQPHQSACPICDGAAMMQRRVTSGPQAGKLFWVCPSFSSCRQAFPVGQSAREGDAEPGGAYIR